MEEKEYREIVKKTFEKIVSAFDSVDPDLAEVDYSQGAVTILFSNRSKLILSQQPSVRQIWVANAAQGVAYHMSYDSKSSSWLDDKQGSFELFSYITKTVQEIAKVSIDFR